MAHRLIEYDFSGRDAVVEFIDRVDGVVVSVAFDGEPVHSEEQQRQRWQAILDSSARHVERKARVQLGFACSGCRGCLGDGCRGVDREESHERSACTGPCLGHLTIRGDRAARLVRAAGVTAMSSSRDLESVWAFREEVLYPQLFGVESRGIFVLDQGDFAALGRADFDPRWLHLGILEYAPTAARPTWLYVTSGGSTPWEQEPGEYKADEYSWLGVEFMLETVEPSDWAIALLKRLMAYHVLTMHGQFGDRPGIGYGSRIPIRAPLDRDRSVLDGVIAVRPQCVSATQHLPSGKFDLVELVGVSSEELDFGKANGTEALVERLQVAGISNVTDVHRGSVCRAMPS